MFHGNHHSWKSLCDWHHVALRHPYTHECAPES
jgi:hypothetical protein